MFYSQASLSQHFSQQTTHALPRNNKTISHPIAYKILEETLIQSIVFQVPTNNRCPN